MFQHQFSIRGNRFNIIRYIYIITGTKYYIDALPKFKVFMKFEHPHLCIEDSAYIGCTPIYVSRTPELDDIDVYAQHIGNA